MCVLLFYRSFLVYEMWCNTMFSLFGTKWCKIHAGPLWTVTRVAQDGPSEIVRTRNIEEVVRQYMCTNVHQCVHVCVVLFYVVHIH